MRVAVDSGGYRSAAKALRGGNEVPPCTTAP